MAELSLSENDFPQESRDLAALSRLTSHLDFGPEHGGACPIANWMSALDYPLALITDHFDGPRFELVSQGLLRQLGLAECEVWRRRVSEVLGRSVRTPLEHTVESVFSKGVAGSFKLGAQSRAPGCLVSVRPAGPGLATLELTSPSAKGEHLREVLFEHLNLIGAGTSYIYDRSPSAGMNLSILLGFDGEDAGGASIPMKERVHPEDLPHLTRQRLALEHEVCGAISTAVVRMKHSDGGWRWIHVREQALSRGSDGSVSRILGFACDVTEHHELAEAAKRTAAAVLKAEEGERRRIAREMHDSLAQHLVVIDLALSRLERQAAVPLPEDAVEEIRQALQAAHTEVRSFSYLLHPPDLERLGLSDAIAAFASGFGSRTGLRVDLKISSAPDLPSATQLTMFRIMQEALMNVHRHAKATRVEVSLKLENGVLMEIADDGVGMGFARLRNPIDGVGLAGMRARLARLGGVLDVSSGQRGLRLRAWLPMMCGPEPDGTRRPVLLPSDHEQVDVDPFETRTPEARRN